MEKELISIITPCYNVASTLEQYLKSILNQTYNNIEVIAVDDGSTDDTAKILKRYISIFAENKMTLKYIYEDNAGLGAAINNGLKYVEGDYLCWSDPDDFYFPTSMEKRLREFHKHPECAVVSSDAYVYHSNDLKHPFKREAARFICRQEPNQFELLLKEESHFCAGCHMIRMADFEKVNPKREIYPAKRGQNWQLLLPVYYKFKRYYLDEPLYAYVVYPNSMSSGDMTEEKEMNRWGEHEEIIRQTLCRIPLTENEIEKYDNEITIRYAKKRFFTAIDYRDKKMIKEQYMILKDCQENTDEIRALYLRNYYLILKLFYKIKEIFKR
ncbi:MAG: glycosyltransferase family 2 protein [Blautia sp.]